MNDLTKLTDALQMTSLEIADLTGKKHFHVMRDIDTLLDTLHPDLGLGFKSSTYKDSTGKENRLFVLDRDSTVCLVTGYDVTSRMRVIKRWQELEAQVAPTVPQTYLEALRRLITVEEAKLALESQNRAMAQQIETDQPYAELARALTSQSAMTRRDWCAMMKTENGAKFGEKKLTAWLMDSGYLYRDRLTKESRAYAHYSHLFKLEPKIIDGYSRNVIMVTGQAIFELTPKVLAALGAKVSV